jgi:hypothetical protein
MFFNLVEDLNAQNFTELYGDCFIRGFLQGGTFDAIVSIKVNDKAKMKKVKAAAEVDMVIAPNPDMEKEAGDGGAIERDRIWRDTETTISVHYSGGGQLKRPASHWDLKTVMDSASRFHHFVQNESQRTYASKCHHRAVQCHVRSC